VKVLILGATGGTGRTLVDRALALGHQVTALARNPSAVAPEDSRPTVLQGNALDARAVGEAVRGQDAVLFALGSTRIRKPLTFFSESTRIVVGAMQRHGVRRLICVTGIGAGDSRGHGGFLFDLVLRPLVLRYQYEDKDRQEEIIRASDLDWVIVRPARLTDGPATGEYRVFLGGSYTATTISRADVAAFMLAQLTSDSYVRRAPVISY
jgi:putative NADH-flavin reductase